MFSSNDEQKLLDRKVVFNDVPGSTPGHRVNLAKKKTQKRPRRYSENVTAWRNLLSLRNYSRGHSRRTQAFCGAAGGGVCVCVCVCVARCGRYITKEKEREAGREERGEEIARVWRSTANHKKRDSVSVRE